PTAVIRSRDIMLPLSGLIVREPCEKAKYFWEPNACGEPRPMAGARYERRLLGVGSSALILIEAPSSTYHRGMLVVGRIPKKRRRPHAILYEATPIVLRYRSACPHHVCLYPESGRCDWAAPEYARWARTLSQGYRALSGG